ncbi:MAG: hypothetical protein A2Z40_05735 [Deltaproteobacteria bacterium RBG_19FT_COMBO_60_16]|nr:MAG: hypothetical protein A2Z40_05735 [Deltaproteobacteria bacterium RBG_19FT_COMBO_60_16]
MSGNSPKGRLLRDPQAAELLGVRPQTLMNARCTGSGAYAELPYYRMGRAIRYAEEDIAQFLHRHRIQRSGR